MAIDGSHLHGSVGDARGRMSAGHLGDGCIVRTTAEVLPALLPGWRFTREADAQTGWAELVIERAAPPATGSR